MTPPPAPPTASHEQWQEEANKSERRALMFGDLLHQHILAMRAAVVAWQRESPQAGMRWIANTLEGPGHLPSEEDIALGAQALFDKEVAEHEAFRAAHPAPVAASKAAAPVVAPAEPTALSHAQRVAPISEPIAWRYRYKAAGCEWHYTDDQAEADDARTTPAVVRGGSAYEVEALAVHPSPAPHNYEARVNELTPELGMARAMARADFEIAEAAGHEDDIEAVIACLGDDAAGLREENAECEIAANMDVAAATIKSLCKQLDEARSAAVPVAIPEGWQLVPIEPTKEMIEAYNQVPCGIGGSPPHGHWVWSAMVAAAAAPQQPAAPADACARCNGTGVVDDGELDCSDGGIPYENGPIKCVKDCPACGDRNAGALSAAPAEGVRMLAEREVMAITGEPNYTERVQQEFARVNAGKTIPATGMADQPKGAE